MLRVGFLLVTVMAANAQFQVCQNIKPGKVLADDIKMRLPASSNSESDLVFSWRRPQDGSPPSCITEYIVDIYRLDGQKVQQGILPITNPAHGGGTYEAKGLTPGASYRVTVTAKGPGGTGPTDMQSEPFRVSMGPIPLPETNCKQPQAVSNIRRAAAVPSGSQVSMTIAWNPSPSAPACVKEYIITTYLAGSTSAIKTTTVPVSATQFTDNIYQPGKSYEFYIYARNPAMGAMGNGVGLRSQPIMAPTGATPL